MGAKTALLAFADGDLRPVLRAAARSGEAPSTSAGDPSAGAAVEELVRVVHPGYDVHPVAGATLLGGVYPDDDVTYATVLPGATILCDRRFGVRRPSELPAHLIRAGAGRRIILHSMHSVSDWLGFAVWEDGMLIRSLSLSTNDGVVENIGEPFNFERPFWAGQHPTSGWPDQGSHPVPFHPLELGEVFLRAVFGFIVEGHPEPDDVDADEVLLRGFRVSDPSGTEQAAREAAYENFRRNAQLRQYRMAPDGTMQEI
jgi:uncharacterized protein DUF6928